MSLEQTQMEGRLAESYRRQAAIYAHALALADELFANWHGVNDVVGALQPIGALVDEIRQSNRAIEKQRQEWVATAQRAGPHLAAALQDCANMILGLKDRIGDLERLAAERKQSLAPQLDSFARGWQMQRAYSAAKR
ncbi:MAG TPA: hypothetical protein VE988_19610 [Gemmataceae bacterium]|nr:hypothetical protein [Gemmataceae bacterium]